MTKFLLAASAAAAALMAPAANASVNIACPGFSGNGGCTFSEANKTGNFGNSLTAAQSFTDLYTLTLNNPYEMSFTMTNTAQVGGPISFTETALYSGATLIGAIAMTAAPTTFIVGAGTYTIKMTGSATQSASYQGTIDIAAVPVPAPATWGLMLVGVGALGAVSRRRMLTARIAVG